ncbi:MAG: cell division protein ZapA [Elusimicrobiota bacterium]
MIKEKIAVEILGRTYELDAEGMTPMEAGALAQFVSERMEELARNNHVVDTSRLAVLTALNFADELRRLEAQHEELTQTIDRRLGIFKKILEEALKVAG